MITSISSIFYFAIVIPMGSYCVAKYLADRFVPVNKESHKTLARVRTILMLAILIYGEIHLDWK